MSNDDENNKGSEDQKGKRTRQSRPFPAASFEESLELAQAIHRLSGGKSIRRLTLFDELGKAPESGPSRQLITNSNKYGLTKGGYAAEYIELTEDGALASSDEAPPRERTRAQIKCALEMIPIFKALYEKFVGNKLPAKQVLIDAAKDESLSAELGEEATDIFIVNLRFIGLLRTLSGADRIVTIDHLLDTLPPTAEAQSTSVDLEPPTAVGKIHSLTTVDASTFDNICFYITPIGDDGTEVRKHADLFLGSIVEPAVEPFKLKVVRADKIDKPGMITKQIIDHLVNAKLVIADLSYHNPNVFYELAIRHAMRLPTVQIIRKQDRIPFDVGQARTIQIDCSDIYSFVPKIESYRAEIASLVRRALEDPDTTDNPLSTFYPAMKATASNGHRNAPEV